jgi:hypothetical protein
MALPAGRWMTYETGDFTYEDEYAGHDSQHTQWPVPKANPMLTPSYSCNYYDQVGTLRHNISPRLEPYLDCSHGYFKSPSWSRDGLSLIPTWVSRCQPLTPSPAPRRRMKLGMSGPTSPPSRPRASSCMARWARPHLPLTPTPPNLPPPWPGRRHLPSLSGVPSPAPPPPLSTALAGSPEWCTTP